MKLAKRILKVVIVLIISFLFIINIPIESLGYRLTKTDFSNWMSENLNNDDLILDIAMLGAHDAFSSDITIVSPVDPYENNSIFSGVPGAILKGYLVKQAKTQTANVTDLLTSGVRYLDIRLSYVDDVWYTKHNYISSNFDDVANDIVKFLEDNNGEFLVLDFQHVHGLSYESQTDYEVFKTMLSENSLLDYTLLIDDLSTLTYGEVTSNGTESRVIVLAPFVYSDDEILEYSSHMRSAWADSDDFDYVISFLEEEAIEALNHSDKFRVMQAVTTMQINPSGIGNSIITWSLIHRADLFNNYLLEYDDFDSLINNLPIVMIDNAGSNKSNLHDDLMQIIINHNLN